MAPNSVQEVACLAVCGVGRLKTFPTSAFLFTAQKSTRYCSLKKMITSAYDYLLHFFFCLHLIVASAYKHVLLGEAPFWN
uniref:Uncharacterized protein n=1 Tax=Anguilla anguilla TaxID=7936 RepID=A0A0E9WL92_ANGAN